MTTYGFALGTGRCGSTLVQEVLARHPSVGFVTNLDDRFGLLSGPAHVAAYRRLPDGLTEKGRARFAPSEGYRVLAREVSPLLVDPVRDLRAEDATPWLADRFQTFLQRRADRQQLPVFLHKFTGWPRTGFVSAVVPGARFVHVVRDGRAVANSWLQMPWWRGHLGPDRWHFGPLSEQDQDDWESSGRSFVVLAGLAWRLLLRSYRDAASTLPPQQWLELRYEDVVQDPQASFARLTDFLGLEPSEAFLAALARTRFSSGRTDAFRRDLSAADVAALEQVLGEDLATLGYL